MEQRLDVGGTERLLADAHVRMAVHLQGSGDTGSARAHWSSAQELDPDNWNTHRQAWMLEDADVRRDNWRRKFEALGDRPYYEPLDMP